MARVIGSPAAARIGDLATVAVVGDDNSLYKLAQTTPSGGWSAWTPIGQATVGQNAPVPVSPSPAAAWQNWIDLTGLEIAVVGRSDASLYTFQDHDGGIWESLGAGHNGLRPSPAYGAEPDHVALLFAVDNDGVLELPTSPSFLSSTAVLFPQPTIGASQDGRLEVFCVGANDGALWHVWQIAVRDANSWSQWFSHGTPDGTSATHLVGPIAVGPSLDRRLELFAPARDGRMYHIWQVAVNGAWVATWFSHGTPPGTDFAWPADPRALLALAPNLDGRLELVAAGNDGNLWHIWQTQANNGWSDWESLGQVPQWSGQIYGGIALVPSADGRLELFVVDEAAGVLWHIWQTATNVDAAWSPWFSHGSP